MNVTDIVGTAKETLTVKRIYGDPYEKDGVTVIPAATVSGGLGGGGGKDEKGDEGEGGGFGMSGRPAGAYVIENAHVSWQPALDPNRIFTVLGAVAITYLLTRPRLARARALAAPVDA